MPVEDTDTFGLFQIARPMRSEMPPGTFFVGDNPTPARAYEVTEDSIKAARRKTGVYTDWATQQFPSLERFIEQYSKFVPHKTDNPKEKYTMDMAGLSKMRTDLEGMLAKFTSMVAVVERFGGEPGEGSVIKFEHSFDDFGRTEDPKVYDYVAVRKFGKWYVSGRPFVGRAVKWAELLEFIGDARAWVCREFEEVPMPGASIEASSVAVADVARLLSDGDGTNEEIAAAIVALMEKSKKD
jgi:hypothetical protein